MTDRYDICPSRDDAQPHISKNGQCVLCYASVPETPNAEQWAIVAARRAEDLADRDAGSQVRTASGQIVNRDPSLEPVNLNTEHTMKVLKYTHTTYSDAFGVLRPAVEVSLKEIVRVRGKTASIRDVVKALRDAGAPLWVSLSESYYVDAEEGKWGVYVDDAARSADLGGALYAENLLTTAIRTVSALIHDGGSTIDTRTGEPVTDGFIVSAYPARERVFKAVPTVGDVVRYIRANAVLLSKPENFLGSWADTENGTFELAVSARYETEEEATDVARAAKQKAIYDATNGREIFLN